MSKTVRRWSRLGPLVAVVAELMIPTMAFAADASIRPQSAKLVAKGVEVDVIVSFTCPPGLKVGSPFVGMPGGATVYVQQAISRTQQAAGSGYSSGQACTGQRSGAAVSQGTSRRLGQSASLRCQFQLCLRRVRTGDGTHQPLS